MALQIRRGDITGTWLKPHDAALRVVLNAAYIDLLHRCVLVLHNRCRAQEQQKPEYKALPIGKGGGGMLKGLHIA